MNIIIQPKLLVKRKNMQERIHEKRREKSLPPVMPRNSLKLESCISIDNLLPPRMLGPEFTSSSAAFMAILATFPLIVLNVKTAPTCTISGLKAPSESALIHTTKIDTHKTRFMVILKMMNLTQNQIHGNTKNDEPHP